MVGKDQTSFRANPLFSFSVFWGHPTLCLVFLIPKKNTRWKLLQMFTIFQTRNIALLRAGLFKMAKITIGYRICSLMTRLINRYSTSWLVVSWKMPHRLHQCFRSFKIRALFGIGRGASQVMLMFEIPEQANTTWGDFTSWNRDCGLHSLFHLHCSKYFSLQFYIHLWFARWTFLYLWDRFGTNSWLSSSQHMSFDLVIPFPQ